MFLFRLAFIPSSRTHNRRLSFTTFILAALFASGAPLHAAEKSNIVPCNIKLVFGIDDNGMSVVSYDLEMQINNQQGRTIHGVSLHWLNAQDKIIGNKDLLELNIMESFSVLTILKNLGFLNEFKNLSKRILL